MLTKSISDIDLIETNRADDLLKKGFAEEAFSRVSNLYKERSRSEGIVKDSYI